MKINGTEIDFYNEDPDYIKDQLVKKYKGFLNDLVKTLKQDGSVTNNKELHQFHKDNLEFPSLKTIGEIEIKEFIEKLNLVEKLWEHKKITFMP